MTCLGAQAQALACATARAPGFIRSDCAGYAAFCTRASWQLVPRPFCRTDGPSLYGHVQAEYWGVGFLRYFQFKQVCRLNAAVAVHRRARSRCPCWTMKATC